MDGARPMRRKQQGIALVFVLLTVAVLAAIAVQLVSNQVLVIAQARHNFGSDQSLNYALGGEALAREVLFLDFEQDQQKTAAYDGLDEDWSRAVPPLELDNGVMEIQIRDLHSCFDLNTVRLPSSRSEGDDDDPVAPDNDNAATGPGGPSEQPSYARFKNLLNNLSLPPEIADLWADWIDGGEVREGGFGAEDSDYLLNDPAYRAPNTLASHSSELRLLAEVDQEQITQLLEHVCVIPPEPGQNDYNGLRINVNTASAELLQAISGNPNLEALQESVAQLTDLPPVFDELTRTMLQVRSEYFEVSVRADVNGMVTELTSIIRRDPDEGAITLVSRDLGKRFRTRVVVES